MGHMPRQRWKLDEVCEKKNATQHQHERKNTFQYTKVHFVPTSQRIFWKIKNPWERYETMKQSIDSRGIPHGPPSPEGSAPRVTWMNDLDRFFQFPPTAMGRSPVLEEIRNLEAKIREKNKPKPPFWWLFAWIFLERVDFLFVNLPWIRNLIMQKSANNLFIDADSLGLLFALQRDFETSVSGNSPRRIWKPKCELQLDGPTTMQLG